MKINELRIGNLLSFEGIEQFVSSIHSDNTIRLKKDVGGSCHGCYKLQNEKIKPIPLTEEWLTILGLEKEHSVWVGYKEKRGENWVTYEKNDFIVHFGHGQDKLITFYFVYEGFASEEVELNINWVHQLQNLYFALTGEELVLITN